MAVDKIKQLEAQVIVKLKIVVSTTWKTLHNETQWYCSFHAREMNTKPDDSYDKRSYLLDIPHQSGNMSLATKTIR